MVKKTVLITGASSGIGYELSKLFAKAGFDLVLVARERQKLKKVADELNRDFGISARFISADLSKKESPRMIFSELRKESIHIDILVNNAGFNVYGPFSETDIEKELDMLQVNLISVTQMTKLFLPAMIKRRDGKILNIGSTGSFVSCPLDSVYCATKAYVLSFSEAIAEELDGTGVTVTVLCPGPTKTEFAKKAHMEDTNLFKSGVMDAGPVAKIGYRALMNGKRVVIAGIANKLLICSTKFAPRTLVAKIGKGKLKRG